MKKLLIIGASGQLGSSLMRYPKNYNVYGTFNKKSISNLIKLDITDVKNVEDVFNKIQPDIAVLSSAFVNVDECEILRQYTYNVNIEGVKNIIKQCKINKCKLVYLSTDYVFDGKNGPYREEDKTNPVNYYGLTKLIAEELVLSEFEDSLCIRTTGIFGWKINGTNFFMQVYRKLSSGIEIKVPIDQYGSPTLSYNLAGAVLKLIELKKKGIYNVVGTDVVSRYHFSCKIADKMNLNSGLIKGVTTENLNQKAPRPLKAGLIIEKFKNEVKDYNLFNITQALDYVYKEFKNENIKTFNNK